MLRSKKSEQDASDESQSYEKQSSDEVLSTGPEKSGPRKPDKKITLRHPSVRAGTSSVGVYVDSGMFGANGKPVINEVSIEQVNGVFQCENIEKNYPLRDALKASGWLDETHYALSHNEPVAPPKRLIPYHWYFQHPEHTEDFQVNSVIGFHIPPRKIGDETVTEMGAQFVDGAFDTSDEDLARAMEKAGFWLVKTDAK